jgi:hypothetical protein
MSSSYIDIYVDIDDVGQLCSRFMINVMTFSHFTSNSVN